MLGCIINKPLSLPSPNPQYFPKPSIILSGAFKIRYHICSYLSVLYVVSNSVNGKCWNMMFNMLFNGNICKGSYADGVNRDAVRHTDYRCFVLSLHAVCTNENLNSPLLLPLHLELRANKRNTTRSPWRVLVIWALCNTYNTKLRVVKCSVATHVKSRGFDVSLLITRLAVFRKSSVPKLPKVSEQLRGHVDIVSVSRLFRVWIVCTRRRKAPT